MPKQIRRPDTIACVTTGESFPVTVHETVYPVDLTYAEMQALNTLCELELGSRENDRIEAWRHADTAQDKLLAVLGTI